MDAHQVVAPVRGALFYTVHLLLLATIGTSLQVSLGVSGIVLSRLLLFVGVTVVWIRSLEHRPAAAILHLRPLPWPAVARSALLGLVAALLAQVLGVVITLLIEAAGGSLPQTLYPGLTDTPFVVALLTWALLPAISEEIAYRGYLQWSLHPLGARLAVVATAVLFGAMHHSLVRLIPLALLGLIFGAAVQRTGSLLSAVIMHFVNNALALALTYYVSIPTPSPGALPVLLLAALVLGGATWRLTSRLGSPVGLLEQVTGPDLRAVKAGVLGCLIPALLLYAYSVYQEVTRVFG